MRDCCANKQNIRYAEYQRKKNRNDMVALMVLVDI
jgi:hypothetical protein